MNIGIYTPVTHLDGIVELLSKKGNVFYDEYADKKNVKLSLVNNKIDVIICNPNRQGYIIDKDLLEYTNVSIINTCSTGVNHIDIEYCKKNNIQVLSLSKDYELLNDLPSTSELAFGLLLDLSRSISKSSSEVKNDLVWDYTKYIGNQIKDMKVGIVGFGRLGKMMAHYCYSFGADVYVYDPYVSIDSKYTTITSLEELFKICDSISLHIHATEKNRKLIKLNLFQNNNVKYLINTSRGEIVDEIDIATALNSKMLLGYGADVLESEFDDISKSILLSSNFNVIITPHIGGMTIEGQTKAFKYAINKLKDIK